jgi:hypothetical protein
MRKNLIGSALLALDAELVLYRNCEWTEMRESRLKQRNFELILFFESACVKENRKLPSCKKRATTAHLQALFVTWERNIGCGYPDFPGAIQFLGYLVERSFRQSGAIIPDPQFLAPNNVYFATHAGLG